jgi:hypothetical protein
VLRDAQARQKAAEGRKAAGSGTSAGGRLAECTTFFSHLAGPEGGAGLEQPD